MVGLLVGIAIWSSPGQDVLGGFGLAARPSMFSRIVPHPIGRNGYEEYVRAADIADSVEFKAFSNWLAVRPDDRLDLSQPRGIKPDDPELLVQQRWASRFSGCCDLVSLGNGKEVFDPRTELTAATTFPEFAAFKSVARLEVATAQVKFAAGQTGEGLRHVFDAMTFGQKMSGTILIGRLVGIACQSIAYRELDRVWPQLNLDDVREVQRYMAALIALPPAMRAALDWDFRFSRGALVGIAKNPASLKDFGYEDMPDSMKALSGLSQSQLNDAVAQALVKFDGFTSSVMTVLNGPEAGWSSIEKLEAGFGGDPHSVSDALAGLVLPTISAAVTAELRTRTFARLAYLTAKAAEFKWLNGRRPEKMEEFTTKEERTDPTGGGFEIRPFGPWFEIVRTGKDTLGEQKLRPKPVATEAAAPSQP
jgi:hypothetical protein